MSSTDGSGSNTVITTRQIEYSQEEAASEHAGVCVGGEVSHFNPRHPNSIQLKGSSARSSNYIDDSAAVENGSFVPGHTYTIVRILGSMGTS